MKRKLIEVALLSCLISLLIACGPKKEEPTATPAIDIEQVKKDIQAKENQFAELYNTRELVNIGYYADDAISFSQNKAPLVGKPAIVEYMKPVLKIPLPATGSPLLPRKFLYQMTGIKL